MGNINLANLDKIFKKTIASISESKEQISEIAENARKECINLEKDYNNIKEELKIVFKNISSYERNLKMSREKLMEANKNYNKYSEDEKESIYLITDKLRVDLAVEREREQMLIKMRTDLEFRLKLSKETVEKAESLVNRVGVVMDFLDSDLSDLSNQLEDINNKHLLAIRVLESQERDRKKLSHEIHDSIAQTISNIVIKSELCNKLVDIDSNRAKAELKNLKAMSREALQEVRTIIYNLRPMSLDDLGIIPTLDRHIKKIIEGNKLNIVFTVTGNERPLQTFINVALFRVTQECLNNIIKHSYAKNVKISLHFSDKYVELFIKDDGVGFDCDSINCDLNTDSKYGIAGMKERLKLLNGNFTIKSQINKGTTCVAKLEIQ